MAPKLCKNHKFFFFFFGFKFYARSRKNSNRDLFRSELVFGGQ